MSTNAWYMMRGDDKLLNERETCTCRIVRFFCPSLECLSDILNLSPELAGATLLSFANGAPDVFTQLASVGTTQVVHVPLAVSAVLGGGFFVTNVVRGFTLGESD